MMEIAEVILALADSRFEPCDSRCNSSGELDPDNRPTFDLDVGLALDLLAQAVQCRGEAHVDQPVWLDGDEYLTCLYAHDGVTRCIVGEVMFRAGVSIAALEAMGDGGIRDLYLAGRLPIKVTPGALLVLERAQMAQDQGQAWGEAFRQAGEVALVPAGIAPVSVVGERSFWESDWTSHLTDV